MPTRHPRRPPRAADRRCADGGAFTAVEMLIVIFIISLLLAFIVVAVHGLRGRAMASATRSTIATLQVGCERYFNQWNFFPPDNFADLGAAEPARHQALRDASDTELVRIVTGPECLVIALSSPKLRGPFYDLDPKGMCDLDEDAADSFPFYLEIADGWGRPIRYENLGDTVGVRLWSAGRDMQFGTDDDLSNR